MKGHGPVHCCCLRTAQRYYNQVFGYYLSQKAWPTLSTQSVLSID